MLQMIFTILGILILIYVVIIIFVFLLKVSFFSSLVGASFVLASVKVYSQKWWAWIIQFPFLIFYGLFIYFEGWASVGYIVFFQILVSLLIIALLRISEKNNLKI
jgi:hypothetical protein